VIEFYGFIDSFDGIVRWGIELQKSLRRKLDSISFPLKHKVVE